MCKRSGKRAYRGAWGSFSQDAVPTGEPKNQKLGTTQTRQVALPANINMGQVWGRVRLRLFITPTGRPGTGTEGGIAGLGCTTIQFT